MKKFTDILQEIKQTRAALEAAEAKEKQLINSFVRLDDIKSRMAAKKAVDAKMLENAEQIENLKITVKILKHNAIVALYHEALPAAVEVFNKYKGKPYGEKTRHKIADEIKEKTRCLCYIAQSYSSYSIGFYPVDVYGNDYNITCGIPYVNGEQKPLLIDNKIQPVTVDDITLWYMSNEYVEDVPQRVEDLKTVYREAVAKQKELKSICSRYNNMAVGKLAHIYHDKRIYENMYI